MEQDVPRGDMATTAYLQHAATDSAAENLGLLRAQWRQNEPYRAYVSILRKWDSGDQIADINSMPNEQYDHQAKKLRWAPRLFGAALDALSYLYAQDPVRDATNKAQWRRVLWSFRYKGNLNSLMRSADRAVRRDGTVLCVAAAGSSTAPGVFMDSADANGVDLFYRTRDQFEVLEHKSDPRYVGAALIWWGTDSFTNQHGRTLETDVFRYIDDEIEAFATEDGALYNVRAHGLTTCPAVTLRNCYPSGLKAGIEPPLMGPPVGGRDIISNLQSLNRFQEEVIWTGILQRGQFVIAQKDKAKDLAIAPDNPWGVEEVGGAWVLQGGANIGGQLDVLQMMLSGLSAGMGLPQNYFVVSTTAFPNSAAVIQAQELNLTKDRNARASIATVWEVDVSRIAAVVNNELPGDIDLEPIAGVEYMTSPQPLTHADKLAEVRVKQEFALGGRESLLRQVSPHLSDKELKKELADGKADVEFFTEMATRRAGHAMDTAGAGALGGDDGPSAETLDTVVEPVAEGRATEGEVVAVAQGGGVEDAALNGAQQKAMWEVLLGIARGEMNVDAAADLIAMANPSKSEQEIRQMTASAALTPRPEPTQPAEDSTND